MDITLFRQILSYEVFHHSCFAIVILLICLYGFFAKRKESYSGYTLGVLLATVAVITVVWSMATIPVIKDLNTSGYVEIHASYKRNKNENGEFMARVYIESEDMKMVLYLPHKDRNKNVGDEDHYISYSEELFPIGEYEGTIWYSENSHYILKFMPDP